VAADNGTALIKFESSCRLENALDDVQGGDFQARTSTTNANLHWLVLRDFSSSEKNSLSAVLNCLDSASNI
jgi:hypothetical protein